MDHRRHRRYHLAIPVDLRDGASSPSAVQTATRDISAKGVYFTVSPDFGLGTEVDFELALPPQMCQGRSVRVRCRGRVVRLDPADEQGRIGVAAVIDEYEFVQAD